MAGTQDWVFGLILYFVGLFIVVSLFSIGGMISPTDMTTDTRFSTALSIQVNQTQTAEDLGFSIGDYFSDVFSFFFWDIQFLTGTQLFTYMWLIRIVLVYLPFLALVLSIYYSLPTVSGGG